MISDKNSSIKFSIFEELTPIQSELITELSHSKFLTRADLVIKLNKPRTTIYDNLEILEEKNLVSRFSQKFSKKKRKRGRPFIFWFITRNLIDEILYELFKKNEEIQFFIDNALENENTKKLFVSYFLILANRNLLLFYFYFRKLAIKRKKLYLKEVL